MKIEVKWWTPIVLLDGSEDNLIYKIDFDDLPESPGVYIFARCYGNELVPLYIGQAKNLYDRIETHFYKNVNLMQSIKHSQYGKRVLLIGELRQKQGQKNIKKALGIIESVLIDRCMSEDYALLNKQGTKRPFHTIVSKGPKNVTKLVGRKMKSPARN